MPETVHRGALWTGVLGPPILWLAQFELNFALVPVCCASGRMWPIHLVTALTLMLTGLCGLIAWRSRSDVEYAQFMAWGGAGLSAIFLVATLAQGMVAMVLHPCQ